MKMQRTMDTYSTKLAVRDSLDDDDLSDVDDEVFIRDGKHGSKLVEDRGVKRPLMAPRRKMCKEGFRSRRPPCRIKCVFYCYAVIALTILLGLIGLTVLLVSLYPLPMDRLKPWFSSSTLPRSLDSALIRPCTSLRVSNIWNVTIPKLITESAIRSLDVNQDGVKDIIIGYETENGPKSFIYLCPMFFANQTPCKGGVLALDGKNGAILWQHWTAHVVYSLDCSADITGDKLMDCLVMGRGLLCAIDGRNGSMIWQFPNSYTPGLTFDIYVGQTIPDQDGDGVVDMLVSHTVQKGAVRSGHLILISGKTGSEIVEIATPDNTETYYMPQLLKRTINNTAGNSSTEQMSSSVSVLFGTGGQDTPGGLYVFPLTGFSVGSRNVMKPMLLYQDRHKGLLQPAILVDITGDTVEDIIICTFNGTVIAMDGVNFKQIWNYTRNSSESYSSMTPGYFNDDNITDFLVKFNRGNGFPEYFYAETLLINGKTGKQMFHKPILESAPTSLAGVTIGVESKGFDMFLYWIGICRDHEDASTVYERFSFMPGQSIWMQSRADICKLRFNTSSILKLYALNQYDQPPGILVYSTDDSMYEYNKTYSSLAEAKQYLEDHPDFEMALDNSQSNIQMHENYYGNLNEELKTNIFKGTKEPQPGVSSFRHKEHGEGLLRDFTSADFVNHPHGTVNHKHIEGDEWPQQSRPTLDWAAGQYPQEGVLPLDPNLQMPMPDDELYEDDVESRSADLNYPIGQNRDPRSKDQFEDALESSAATNHSQEETVNEEPLIGNVNDQNVQKRLMKELNTYDEYVNIQNAKNRLLHDLSIVPSDILRESYLENADKDLRTLSSQMDNDKFLNSRMNKFEQRDLRYRQNDRTSVKKELETMYDKKRRESLWDLESEKEQYDREHGYWRGKREMVNVEHSIPKIDSAGILLDPLTPTENSIDFIFAVYWLPVQTGAQIILPKDKICINKKINQAKAAENKYHSLEKTTMEDLFTKMCLEERGVKLLEPNPNDPKEVDPSPYAQDINFVSLGQLTIHRLNLQCDCGPLLENESCGRILKSDQQSWQEYLGVSGKGYFFNQND